MYSIMTVNTKNKMVGAESQLKFTAKINDQSANNNTLLIRFTTCS